MPIYPTSSNEGRKSEDETKIRYLTGRKLSDDTIAQRIVACRLFYDFLLRKHLRSDPVNPIARGNDGRDGQHPVRGPVSRKRRLPWIPPDEVWEGLVRHVVTHEDARIQAKKSACFCQLAHRIASGRFFSSEKE